MAAWVAREVLPHEQRLRARLARSRVPSEDIDELIQESYCRLALLDSVDHIECPRAYFFAIARNLLLRKLRRQQIVSLDTIAEIESMQDDRPDPERAAGARLDYGKVRALIAKLPERCRRIVELRKIEGWSQIEIAEHLGITEKAVEKQVWLGVRAVREAFAHGETRFRERIAAPGEGELQRAVPPAGNAGSRPRGGRQ